MTTAGPDLAGVASVSIKYRIGCWKWNVQLYNALYVVLSSWKETRKTIIPVESSRRVTECHFFFYSGCNQLSDWWNTSRMQHIRWMLCQMLMAKFVFNFQGKIETTITWNMLESRTIWIRDVLQNSMQFVDFDLFLFCRSLFHFYTRTQDHCKSKCALECSCHHSAANANFKLTSIHYVFGVMSLLIALRTSL